MKRAEMLILGGVLLTVYEQSLTCLLFSFIFFLNTEPVVCNPVCILGLVERGAKLGAAQDLGLEEHIRNSLSAKN